MRTFVTSLLLATIALVSCKDSKNRHVGSWMGTTGDGKSVGIVLDKEGKAMLIDDGDTMKEDTRYAMDYTKEPAWLDLIVKQDTVRCLVRFVNDDKMELRSNPGGARPDKFDPADKIHSVTLSRSKK